MIFIPQLTHLFSDQTESIQGPVEELRGYLLLRALKTDTVETAVVGVQVVHLRNVMLGINRRGIPVLSPRSRVQ